MCYGDEDKEPITSFNLYRIESDEKKKIVLQTNLNMQPIPLRKLDGKEIFKSRKRKTSKGAESTYFYGEFDLTQMLEK